MNKYNAKKVKYDGYTFDSKAEHARYCELKLLEKSGLIVNLKVHEKWPLFCNGVKIGYYESDFSYQDRDTGKVTIEDCKGVRTDLYKWKKKHFELEYPVKITEITKGRRK